MATNAFLGLDNGSERFQMNDVPSVFVALKIVRARRTHPFETMMENFDQRRIVLRS